jgi:hypothetical protein
MSFIKEIEPVAVAAPVVTVPVAIGVNWEEALKEMEEDPLVKKLIDMKRVKETTVYEEDNEDDEGTVVRETLTPKQVIIEVVKTDAILRRCARLEAQNKYVSELNQQLEESVRTKDTEHQTYVAKAEHVQRSLCDQLAAAREEVERLKRRLTPHVEIIEHSN